MRPRTVGEIESKEWLTAAVTGIAGIVNGGVLMTLGDPGLMQYGIFWELYVVSGLIGIAVLPPIYVTATNPMADSVIAVTAASDWLAGFMGDLVSEFGLASVTAPIGIGIGLVLWVVFGVFLIPITMGALGQSGVFTVPHFGLGMFIGYFFYGFSLGGFFGLAIPELHRRTVAPGTPADG